MDIAALGALTVGGLASVGMIGASLSVVREGASAARSNRDDEDEREEDRHDEPDRVPERVP